MLNQDKFDTTRCRLFPDAGGAFGDPADVFEKVIFDYNNPVLAEHTMYAVGTAYWYRTTCPDHSGCITPHHMARYSTERVWSVPCRSSTHSLQYTINEYTCTKRPRVHEERQCLFCLDAEPHTATLRAWSRILPPEEDAPPNLVLTIQPPQPEGRVCPSIPLYISAPVNYYLVGVVFSKPGHFVSQFLAGDTWFSYHRLLRRGE